MKKYDITILTCTQYLKEEPGNTYVATTIREDEMIAIALGEKGLRVTRTNWDNPDFDWTETRYALFRTTWDYSYQFDVFFDWFEHTSKLTTFINSYELIRWNIDKNYLKHFQKSGIRIPKTVYLPKGSNQDLVEIIAKLDWSEYILKPAIAAGARHTYYFKEEEASKYISICNELMAKEDLLLQEYLPSIKTKGEISLMWFNNTYSHAILKRAKQGDFRVQEDHGGTVHTYQANTEEIKFAKRVLSACEVLPVYSRVDLVWDKEDQLCLGELEIFEPELWLRASKEAVSLFVRSILNYIKGGG